MRMLYCPFRSPLSFSRRLPGVARRSSKESTASSWFGNEETYTIFGVNPAPRSISFQKANSLDGSDLEIVRSRRRPHDEVLVWLRLWIHGELAASSTNCVASQT